MKNRKEIDNVPTNIQLMEIDEILSYANNLDRLVENSSMVKESPGISIKEGKGKERDVLCVHTGNATVKFLVPKNIDGISGNNTRAADIFAFIMSRLCEKANDFKQWDEREATFNLDELVEYGLFSASTNARRALHNTFYALDEIGVEITQDKTKRYTKLLSALEIKNGKVTATLGKYIEWDMFAKPYVGIPLKEVFNLSYKASNVCRALYSYIRSKACYECIKLPISFIILKGNVIVSDHNPARTKRQVKDIIDEINANPKLRIHIVPKYSEEKDLRLWIKKSFILVYVNGYLANDMKDISNKRDKRRENCPKIDENAEISMD